jgi:thiosulfate/3-mercaptopyruvate sulfurtransferase
MLSNTYSHPEVLCETEWVGNNLENPNLRILEVDYDPENAYKLTYLALIWFGVKKTLMTQSGAT